MRLTNFMRETFVRAVMADVPKKDFNDEIIKITKEAVHYSMPKEIVAALNNAKVTAWLNTAYLSLPDGCSSFNYYKPESGLKLADTAPMYWEKLVVLGKENMNQNKTINELQRKLETCAAACNTRKQLADMLPEFEKYLPPDEEKAAKQYPLVANVVADFVNAGWPKGGTK